MTEAESELVMTVAGAWSLYDMQEAELWREYAARPTYLQGKAYLADEKLAHTRMMRTLERIRRQNYNKRKRKEELLGNK